MNDKQTQAVMYNLKEQRCLQKTIQTLTLEESYSLSLINLNNKVMKVNYKRLKDRVSKIKSSLSAEEINEMKMLEENGEIPETAKKTEFDSRINAASKRLKLWPTKRAQSATPRGSIKEEIRPHSAYPATRRCESSTLDVRRCKTALGTRAASMSVKSRLWSESETSIKQNNNTRKHGDVKRDAFIRTLEPSKSVEFVTDLPNDKLSSHRTPDAQNTDREPKSILKREATAKKETYSVRDKKCFTDIEIIIPSTEPICAQSKDSKSDYSFVPTETAETNIQTVNEEPETKQRTDGSEAKRVAKTIQRANAVRQKSIADLRRASKLMSEGKTSVPFDSHSPEANDTSKVKQKAYRPTREGAMYGIEFTTMENNIGGDLHKEIKKGLLLGEFANSLYLEDKIDHYIDKVETYLEDTRRQEKENEAELVEQSKLGKRKPVRNLLRRRQLQLRLRYSLDNPGVASWEDLVNCRYLRHPDVTIDNSDVMSTLVTDQRKLLEHMKMVGYEVIEPGS